MSRITSHFICGLLLAGFVVGCHHNEAKPTEVNFRTPLPEGMVALRKLPLEQFPQFTMPSDPAALSASLKNSLDYLSKPSSNAFYPYLDITHDRAVATCKRMLWLCQQMQSGAGNGPTWLNERIRNDFDVYKSIGAPTSDGRAYTDRVLFTGYFTPIYDASMTRTAEYQWPLYKAPLDLARDPVTLEAIGRKEIDGQILPCYTREEIEMGGKLTGGELVWLKSRWEEYVITIQGSARLRLPDGKIYEVGFAGSNGFDYVSPGMQMIADGVITQDQLTFTGLRDYFQLHPDAMDKYLSLNKRFVFFTERPGGPFGKLNVPVTAFASIATDKAKKDIYPRAMPAFVMTSIEAQPGTVQSFSNFMMDQDTGGTIRASGRCDIYMGVGPDAEKLAGQELHEGSLYYLAVKELPPGFPSAEPQN